MSVMTAKALNDSLRKTLDDCFAQAYNSTRPDYHTRRKYGKYTIYNKEGMRVVWGLNEREMRNYMKLLKKEE